LWGLAAAYGTPVRVIAAIYALPPPRSNVLGVRKLDIRLNDLRKRLLQQSGAESAATPVVRARDLAASTQTRNDSPEAIDPEPRIYSVRRLLQNFSPEMEPVEEPASPAPATAENGSAAAPHSRPHADAAAHPESLPAAILDYVAKSESSEYQLFQAVSKVFEETRTLQDRLAKLPLEYEPVERLARSIAALFGPLEAFQDQVTQLARAFEPMKAIQLQVAQLAQNFAPVRALEQQLENLASAFQIHLGMLVRALDPAVELQARAAKLAIQLAPAQSLQNEFTRLARLFVVPDSATRPVATSEPATVTTNPEEPPAI